jgi:hypothetical protein
MKPATSPPKGRRRTLKGVLRERLPQIEATLRAGYRVRTIFEQLAQEGFHITLGAFRDGFCRARLWRRTYGPLHLPPGDPFSVTSAWLVGEVASRLPQLVGAQMFEAVGHCHCIEARRHWPEGDIRRADRSVAARFVDDTRIRAHR